MHAYDEKYLNDAMKNLGEAFDYSATILNIPMDNFLDMFIISGIANQFAAGASKFVSGFSGTELVWEILNRTEKTTDFPAPKAEYDYSPEYWCGWILAFYQWHTGKSFKEIKKYLPMSEIYKLYPTLHEASEEKFIDVANSLLEHKKLTTKLQTIRKATGLSQKELAEKSSVNLRMIQQYEQRAKNINKATGIHLFALAQALCCKTDDLLEF